MVGYKTFATAAALFIAGAIARWGYRVDPEVLATTLVVVGPALMALLRSITHTSPGQGS